MSPHRLTDRIPDYLQPYVAQQDPSLYTPMDHAGWRFIMTLSKEFFATRAHPSYLLGLEKTGISSDRIPLISEMDDKLRAFGWRAVAVSGFIPPAVFMEFLSLGVLPIACDMRQVEHLAYTPAPDIVHEAAGHAPIIADPSYAAYLRSYGEVAQKAIFSHHDTEVYRAIRKLSDVKEDPASTSAQVEAAQRELDEAVSRVDSVSEATLLARMNWWTIEYGMVGTMEEPRIYGAGLLSSLGESFHCFDDAVQKRPFDGRCIDQTYDITKPQPQLYVTPDFEVLTRELERLAATMAFRKGGKAGLEKALAARTVTTSKLETGLQISGLLAQVREKDGVPVYLRWEGPTQLAFADRELEGQGVRRHAQGYSIPLGAIQGGTQALQAARAGDQVALTYASGIQARGRLTGKLESEGRLLLVTLADCTVSWDGEILYRPEWGEFDLALGEHVVSVAGASADRSRYLRDTGWYDDPLNQPPNKPKTNLTEANRPLNELYRRVREQRSRPASPQVLDAIEALSRELAALPGAEQDWLLRYELLELADQVRGGEALAQELESQLLKLQAGGSEKAELIRRGLDRRRRVMKGVSA